MQTESQGVALDMDEVECVAANLIFRKYVRGYISHKNKVGLRCKACALRAFSVRSAMLLCAGLGGTRRVEGMACQRHPDGRTFEQCSARAPSLASRSWS